MHPEVVLQSKVDTLFKDLDKEVGIANDSLTIHRNQLVLVAQGYLGLQAAQAASTAELEAFNGIIVENIDAMVKIGQAQVQRAAANEIANATTMQAIELIGQETIASINVGQIYDESAASLSDLTLAKVKGTQAAQEFVTKTELEATANEANRVALLNYITVQEGIQIPAWMEPTLKNLQAIQQGLVDTGSAAGEFAQQWSTLVAPAFESISKALGEETFGKMRKAIKDLPGFKDFSKETQKDLLDIDNSLKKSQDRFEEYRDAPGDATP